MRAILVKKPGEWSLTDLEKPSPDRNQVLIRSKVVGICKSDLEVLDGSRPEPYVKYPVVIGHEFAGVIEQCGEDVQKLKVGDRVVAEAWWHCDQCPPCMHGYTNLCEDYSEIGFTENGGLGEYVLAHEKMVHRVPDDLSLDVASMVEPVACSVLGVFRANIEPGKKVAIIGPGPIGLICIELCKLFSPSEICLFGTRDERLEVGKIMGAKQVVNLRKEKPEDYNDAFDYVIECAGLPSAVEMSISIGKRGSKLVLLGVIGGGLQVSLVTDDIVFKDMTIFGSVAYTKSAYSKALELLSLKMVNVEPILTHKFSMEECEEAFKTVIDRKDGVIKALITLG